MKCKKKHRSRVDSTARNQLPHFSSECSYRETIPRELPFVPRELTLKQVRETSRLNINRGTSISERRNENEKRITLVTTLNSQFSENSIEKYRNALRLRPNWTFYIDKSNWSIERNKAWKEYRSNNALFTHCELLRSNILFCYHLMLSGRN